MFSRRLTGTMMLTSKSFSKIYEVETNAYLTSGSLFRAICSSDTKFQFFVQNLLLFRLDYNLDYEWNKSAF